MSTTGRQLVIPHTSRRCVTKRPARSLTAQCAGRRERSLFFCVQNVDATWHVARKLPTDFGSRERNCKAPSHWPVSTIHLSSTSRNISGALCWPSTAPKGSLPPKNGDWPSKLRSPGDLSALSGTSRVFPRSHETGSAHWSPFAFDRIILTVSGTYFLVKPRYSGKSDARSPAFALRRNAMPAQASPPPAAGTLRSDFGPARSAWRRRRGTRRVDGARR